MTRTGAAWGVLGALALAVAVLLAVVSLPDAQIGDVDPLSAVIALVALALGAVSTYLSVRALKLQETDLPTARERLAIAVAAAERNARAELLGRHDRTINVRFRFVPARAHDADDAAVVGDLAGIVGYYRALRPGRLLITGAPGAGKTVLAIELVLGLLEERSPADPVPVRMSASVWDVRLPVEKWLANTLRDTYRMSSASADAMVAARGVLPVVDGLDEMDVETSPGYASRAADALHALNAYQEGRSKGRLILTCRTGQYEGLRAQEVQAEDATRIEIEEVDAQEVDRFVLARAADPARWREVVDVVTRQPQGALGRGLSTPWRLTLALVVYEARDRRTGAHLHDPRHLTQPAMTDAAAVRDHLLELYVTMAITRGDADGDVPIAPAVARECLTALATYLERNRTSPQVLGGRRLSGSDIVLHELWPMAGTVRPRIPVLATIMGGAVLVLSFFVGVATRDGGSSAGAVVAGVVVLTAVVLGIHTWRDIWPSPSQTDVSAAATRRGRRRISLAIPLSCLAATLIFFAVTFVLGLIDGDLTTISGAHVTLLAVVWGALSGPYLALDAPGFVGATHPRHIVRNNAVDALLLVFLTVVGLGLPMTAVGGDATVLVPILGAAVMFAAPTGLAALRYIGMLIVARRRTGPRLPWRLGRFMDRCCAVGLMRIAGTAYQFRHRELQDYLARRS